MHHSTTEHRLTGLVSSALALASIIGLFVFFPNTTKHVSAAYNTNLRPQVGINVNSPDQAGREFADTMKAARPQWDSPTNFGDGKGPMDADRWPTADASIIVWEGVTRMDGTYLLSFNGQATLSTSFQYGTFSNQQYNSSTNTTTATMVVTDTGLENFSLVFTNSKRTATSATNTGVTNVKLMRPTYEGSSTPFDLSVTFTPTFKQVMATYTTLRFMNGTNWNTSVNWSDRTRPNELSQFKWLPGEQSEGNNMAYEYMAQLCNETGKDCYINIPHKVTDDYITKVAQLFRYGSDGTNPYTSTQSNPVYAPLHSNLNLYIEYSNEVWNWGFTQTANIYDAAAAEVNAGGSILNYDGNNNNWMWATRYYARRVVQISTIFRTIFGDSAMMTRVRPLLEWQYSNMNNTASSELEFVNSWYNNADGQQHVSNPHPVNYYIWGGGGAVYYDSGNDSAGTVDGIYASGFPYFNGSNNYQSILNSEGAWAHAYGLHDVAYEGGFAVGGDGSTGAPAASFFDPRAKQTMIDSFNDFAMAGGELYVAGTYGQWKTIDEALTDPLVQAAATVNNSSFTPYSPNQGTAIPASGSTTIQTSSRDTNDDYVTSSGGWMDGIGRNAGYLLRISSAKTYSFALNLSSTSSNGKVNVYVDGNLVSTVNVPNTGGATQNVSAGSAFISSGLHSILLKPANASDVNFGAVQSLVVTDGGAITPTATPTSTPPSTMFSTGFESSDPQPTWNDTIDSGGYAGGISNVAGICCGLTIPEASTRSETAHAGTVALMYSGSDTSTSVSYAYLKFFDLSAQNVNVTSSTKLDYWIYPQNTDLTSGSNSTCVAIDLIYSDGSNLRDSGAVDQNGNRAHPAYQCNKLTLNSWNHVVVNLGSVASGKRVVRIDVGYDQPANTGGYRGYLDDVSIYN